MPVGGRGPSTLTPPRSPGHETKPEPLYPAEARTLHIACALSGATVTVGALAWPRLLGPVSQSGVPHASLLAAGFLALGLGAWRFGASADRIAAHGAASPAEPAADRSTVSPRYSSASTARVLAAALCAMGVYLILATVFLRYGSSLYSFVEAGAGDPSRSVFVPVGRLLVGILLAGVPAALMGGALPLMSRLLDTEGDRRGDPPGLGSVRAIAWISLGGASGAAVYAPLLLRVLGARGTCFFAAMGSVAAAALVLGFARRRSLEATPGVGADATENTGSAPGGKSRSSDPARTGAAIASSSNTREPDLTNCEERGSPSLSALALLLTVGALVVLEMVWTHRLALSFGSEIHVLLLAPINTLAGLGLGTALGARLLGRGDNPARLLRWGLLLAAAGGALGIPLLGRVAAAQIELMLALGVSYGDYILAAALVTAAIVLPCAIGAGLAVAGALATSASAPARNQESAHADNVDRVSAGVIAGRLWGAGALGGAFGAIASVHVLIPLAGFQRASEIAVLVLAAAIALTGARIGTLSAAESGAARASVALRLLFPAAFLVLLFLPRWDWRHVHTLYSKYPLSFLQRYDQQAGAPTLGPETMPFLDEGKDVTVSVGVYHDGGKTLFLDGWSEGSDAPEELVTARLLALLPGLFQGDPKRSLVIGLGHGVAADTLRGFRLEKLDVVATSAAEAEAARRDFAAINAHVLDDPHVTVHLNDAGGVLRGLPEASYDVILGGRSQPELRRESGFFTDAFFAEARRKLRPGGVFCQLLHYNGLMYERIRVLVRTFTRSFPEAALFATRGDDPTGDLLLIGSNGPLRLRHLPEDAAVPEGVRAALREVKNPGTQQLVSGLIAGPRDIAAFAGTGAVNTDDHPIFELDAPGDRFLPLFADNLGRLLSAMGRTFLPAGPPPDSAPSGSELARDGFSAARGLPEGDEVLRGMFVLTRVRPGGEDVSRWVLMGREFEAAGSVTGLYRLARDARGPAEVLDIGASLAGATAIRAQGEILVNGHPAAWTASETLTDQTVALGWICPERGRALFVTRRSPLAVAAGGQETAADLATRFPCNHVR